MHIPKVKIIATVFLALTLTGCMLQPQSIPTLTLSERTHYLSNMQSWEASGRFGIRTRNQGHSASMEWQQNKQNYNLYFFGPFASGSARIIGKPGQVVLTTSDGESYKAASPETLVLEHLGWSLPFTHLIYWIRGLPSPHSIPNVTKYDEHNQLRTLQQDDWKIDYQSYSIYSSITLPEKINLSKGDVKLKIIINHWQK
jgi:outer membrane lipoprotein LolB